MIELPKLPGQELEKVAGEVLADAGKSLTSALREIVGAWADRVSAPNRARAKETLLDAEHAGNIKRAREVIEERRRHEFDEIEHRLTLLRRATGRVDIEMIHEQESVEYVFRKAIENNSQDPNKAQERDINQDWLRRFFKYVADVDEKTILDVLAEALNQAAIKGPPVLSAKALDTLRFFDIDTLKMLQFFSHEIGPFRFAPAEYIRARARKRNININLTLLMELGLIKEDRLKYFEIRLGSFYINFSYDAGERFDFSLISLTIVGKSISALLNKQLRVLEEELALPGASSSLLDLQISVGLTKDTARDLGTALISELAESWAIGVEVLLYLDKPTEALTSERRNLKDPFGLSRIKYLNQLSDSNRDIVNNFVDPFNYFDEKQLPTIVRKD